MAETSKPDGDHYVTFTEEGWTVEHSAGCRLSGRMRDCPYLAAVRKAAGGPRAKLLGRWRMAAGHGTSRAQCTMAR